MTTLPARLLSCILLVAMIQGCAHKSYGDPATPVAGEVLGTAIHTRDAEELRYVVLKELTGRFARQRGIAVTQSETDAYVRQVREGLASDRAQKAAKRDELTRRLAATDLPESERRTLTAELESLNRFLSDLAGAGPSAGADPEEDRARQEIAAAFILQWKINRALHRQYGGRIVFQQGGPEPLDAYRWFLEEHQARGDFRILDTSLEAAFWRYYRDDSIHSFYPPGSREAEQAFVVPWWEAK